MHGYEVEVCTELPTIPGTNDADIDNATYKRYDCPTKEEAMKLAMGLKSSDVMGGPVIQEFRRELREPDFPAAGYRKEYIGERVEAD